MKSAKSWALALTCFVFISSSFGSHSFAKSSSVSEMILEKHSTSKILQAILKQNEDYKNLSPEEIRERLRSQLQQSRKIAEGKIDFSRQTKIAALFEETEQAINQIKDEESKEAFLLSQQVFVQKMFQSKNFIFGLTLQWANSELKNLLNLHIISGVLFFPVVILTLPLDVILLPLEVVATVLYIF
jgi:hypothetical protein